MARVPQGNHLYDGIENQDSPGTYPYASQPRLS